MEHMMRLAASAAVLLVATGLAMAEDKLIELEDTVMVAPLGMSVEQIEDLDVYVDGRKVGEVEEVIGTDPASPTALVIDFDGDSVFGDRDDMIVQIARFVASGGRLVTDLSPTEVASLDVWKD